MRRFKVLGLGLAAFGAVAVGLTGASAASGQFGRFQMVAGGTSFGVHSAGVPLALSNKPATYILEMSAKPVALVDVASKAAGHGPLTVAQKAALTQQLRRGQAPVVAAVSKIHGAAVTSRFQGVYNGIAVTLPQREAWRLSSLPGVKAVFASQTYKPAAVTPGDGIPLTNAPQAWGGVNGFTGAGMKIADIDTGIDYTHADFGGSGSTADYQCALANDTVDPANVICNGTPVSSWYGSSAPKIKGGVDLVGDAYNPGLGHPPVPDSNPLDCSGHGTHTAGTLAGFGVDGSGNPYAGAFNSNTINSNAFRIPPGMAPQASLYAVRVFGCSGSVDGAVLLSAMNWAFNNGMDVVNMSLGSSFGSATDPDSVAASNLAADGVITVVASGNAGRNPYLTSSPGAGIGALSVAANDSTASFPAADLTLTKANTTAGGSMVAIDANGVTIPAGTYNLTVINGFGGVGLGCSVASDEAQNGYQPFPPSTIIVVEAGDCSRVAKAIFGQQAGAAGVIMVNNNTGYPPYEGQITRNPDDGQPYTVTIPFLGVQGYLNPSTSANGQALIAAGGGTVKVASDSFANPTHLGLASFSSWGPSPGGILKPEVTAPGVSIISAGMGTGGGGIFLSGTSMATPHTAGEAALVKQAHPTWGAVRFWKDAIVNTANSANVSNYATRGAGAGEIDAYNATHTNVVADGSPIGTASLSFGVVDMTTSFIGTEKITLHNFGAAPATFVVTAVAQAGVTHGVVIATPPSGAPKTVTVAAQSTATVSITLKIAKAKAVDPVTSFNDWWSSSPQFHDVAGLIHFKPVGDSNSKIALNVPYYAVPTLVANVSVSGISSAALKSGATDSNVILKNKNGGVGYADWFSWGGSSPVSPSDIGSADLRADGVQSFPTGNNNSSIVEFALQTTKPWANPAADYVEIDVDVNHDGIPDYAVTSLDSGRLGLPGGQALVIVINLHTNSFTSRRPSGALFNGSTMELRVRFSDLCQSGAPCVTDGTSITYRTFTFDRNGGADSITTNKPFDVFHPSLATLHTSSDTVPGGGTVKDPMTIDPAAWAANPQLGILVLMQNNQNTVGEAKTFSLHF